MTTGVQQAETSSSEAVFSTLWLIYARQVAYETQTTMDFVSTDEKERTLYMVSYMIINYTNYSVRLGLIVNQVNM